jgi:hypothetical protein
MSATLRIVLTGLMLVLVACGRFTPDDIDKAARKGDLDAATSIAAQPAVDAVNRDFAKEQNEANAKVMKARADANREVNKAARNRSMHQARADHDVTIAHAEEDLSVALEKCKTQSAEAMSACAQHARAVQDQSTSAAKTRLNIVNRQISG